MREFRLRERKRVRPRPFRTPREEKGYMVSKRIARLCVVPITPAPETIPVVMPFIFARHKSWLRIIVTTALLCAMAGCGNPTIVGKWRMSGSSRAMVWEFSTNGSVLIGDVRGRYTFGDQNRIKIETPFATSVYQMEISGDRMILQEPGGSKLEFTRIREKQG